MSWPFFKHACWWCQAAETNGGEEAIVCTEFLFKRNKQGEKDEKRTVFYHIRPYLLHNRLLYCVKAAAQFNARQWFSVTGMKNVVFWRWINFLLTHPKQREAWATCVLFWFFFSRTPNAAALLVWGSRSVSDKTVFEGFIASLENEEWERRVGLLCWNLLAR